MNKSISITKLAEALAKAQGEMPAVEFDAKNPFLKNKYASLGALIKAARPVLFKFGLSIAQMPTNHPVTGQLGVTTTLMHTSGEFIEDTVYLNADTVKGQSSAQSAGVVITYLRRYSLAAMLAMYAEEDVDGEDEKASPEKPAAKKSGSVKERVVALAKSLKADHKEEVSAAIKKYEASGNPNRIDDEETLKKLETDLKAIQ